MRGEKVMKNNARAGLAFTNFHELNAVLSYSEMIFV